MGFSRNNSPTIRGKRGLELAQVKYLAGGSFALGNCQSCPWEEESLGRLMVVVVALDHRSIGKLLVSIRKALDRTHTTILRA